VAELQADISWLGALTERAARFEDGRVVGFDGRGQGQQHVHSPVIVPLLQEGLILASGEDAEAFLQGQLSNDVTQVSARRGQLAAYCSPKGRVLATLLLWVMDGNHALQLPRESAEPIARRLKMYILRSRVRLAVVSDKVALIGVTGPEAARLVREELGISLVSAYEVGSADGVTAIALPGDRVQVAAAAERGGEVWDRLAHRAVPAGQSTWDQLSIANGIPWLTAATEDQFVPQMLNLEMVGGVSFTKGCYPGQEIVARSQHLGQVKRRLARFASVERAGPGDSVLTAGQRVGTIVNVAPAAPGGWEVLAVVQIDAGGTLNLRADGPSLQPLPLPYASPGAPADNMPDRG
jgi:folate-binding protein YgfZ